MKLLVMYHSGVGNTRLIAELLNNRLEKTYDVEMHAIEEIDNTFPYENFDAYIIGFPTYHAHPSVSILNFTNNLEKFNESKPAYIFTTCGWFSANSLRIFAKVCITRNIIPVLYQSYRCNATDGVLLAPFIKAFFTFEKTLVNKIEDDVIKISQLFDSKPAINLPRIKLIGILNYPNKIMGQSIKVKVYLHKENCTKCGKCIRNCNRKALTNSEDQYPMFDKHKCERCYRCIHHCPAKALSLSRRRLPKRQLAKGFFDSYIKANKLS